MATQRDGFTIEEARAAALKLGVDWATAEFKLEDLCDGMKVELEHGLKLPATNVTNDDPIMTAKIALAHLNEAGCYYKHLEEMESMIEENKSIKDLKGDAKEIGRKIQAANMLRAKATGMPVDVY